MTLAEAIYSHLTADADVSALVGSAVYPVTAPQQDENSAIAPMIVYALSDRRHEYSFGDRALIHTTWTFICAAASYDLAHQISEALIAALDHYRGSLPAVSGVSVQNIELVNSQDVEDEFELGIFQVRTDFEIVY